MSWKDSFKQMSMPKSGTSTSISSLSEEQRAERREAMAKAAVGRGGVWDKKSSGSGIRKPVSGVYDVYMYVCMCILMLF